MIRLGQHAELEPGHAGNSKALAEHVDGYSEYGHVAAEEELQDVFGFADANGDGLLDRDEMVALAKKLGLSMKKKDIDRALQEMDSNNDGSVDFAEFLNWWPTKKEKPGELIKALNDEVFLRSPQACAIVETLASAKGPPPGLNPVQTKEWHKKQQLILRAKGAALNRLKPDLAPILARDGLAWEDAVPTLEGCLDFNVLYQARNDPGRWMDYIVEQLKINLPDEIAAKVRYSRSRAFYLGRCPQAAQSPVSHWQHLRAPFGGHAGCCRA